MTIEIEKLERIDLQPGEFLAVHLDSKGMSQITNEGIWKIEAALAEAFDLQDRIVVFRNGVRLEAVNAHSNERKPSYRMRSKYRSKAISAQ